MNRGLRLLSGAVLAAALLVLGRGAWAAEAECGAEKTRLREIKDGLGLSLYVQGGYTHAMDARLEDDNDIPLRVFDKKDDSFLVDLAELNLYRQAPEEGGVGYGFKLSLGETARFIHAVGLGDPDPPVDLTEAYAQALAPVGKGPRFTFGKFVTMVGAEVIEAEPNLNYSRSFLFNFAIPFTHTGLKMSYPVADSLSLGFAVLNGWDDFTDNNDGKTLDYEVCYNPSGRCCLALNFMYGPEQDDNDSHARYLLDLVATVKNPLPGWTFMANYDWGYEEQVPDIGNARWWGVAGYAAYALNDMLSAAVRAETFNDPTGARGVGGRVYEVTLSPQVDYRGLVIRPEYRHDWSPENAFNGGTNSQDTVALGLMYTW
ncbi:MAG: outer membrane beta-barrel protein [Pseudomonadota bacterium]